MSIKSIISWRLLIALILGISACRIPYKQRIDAVYMHRDSLWLGQWDELLVVREKYDSLRPQLRERTLLVWHRAQEAEQVYLQMDSVKQRQTPHVSRGSVFSWHSWRRRLSVWVYLAFIMLGGYALYRLFVFLKSLLLKIL